MTPQTIREEAAQNAEFNSTAEAKFSDTAMADEATVFEAFLSMSRCEPGYFLRELSDSIEWLASYSMHSVGISTGHNLSTEERQKYAPMGAGEITS